MHPREPNRLKGHDYSQDGYYYFVTVCTVGRAQIFGHIENGRMILNEFGQIVHDEWFRSQDIRPGIELDAFVVMPNHMHGIIFMRDNVSDANVGAVGAHSCAPLQRQEPASPQRRPRSLGSFIAGFKSSTTKRVNKSRQSPGQPVWQRNYHDHIIRANEALERIREYITNNPAQWDHDPENMAHRLLRRSPREYTATSSQ